MSTENVVSKELLSHLSMLEAEHQVKVLKFIKELLNMDADEDVEMNQRAEVAEQDIQAGKVKQAETFKQEFVAWQRKKRADIKL